MEKEKNIAEKADKYAYDLKNDNALDFEDFKEEDFSSTLKGNSDEVLTQAYFEDTGKAITTPDLFTEGSYPLHIEDGAEVWADRWRNGEVRVRVHVMPWRDVEYKKELKEMKEKWADEKNGQKPIYHVKAYHVAILAALHDVHPLFNEKEFEQVLWDEMPEAWIDTSKAPKRIIT